MKRIAFLFLLGLLFTVTAVALSQSTDEACPVLVETALTEVGNNCGELNRNSACYGFNRVDATFANVTDETFFSSPADRAELVNLQTIQTAPLDPDLERWGIAVMNVQANVPNSLPGQAVVFMLLGDVQVENAVAEDNAFAGVEPISVTALVAANLRSFPSLNANVVASVAANAELSADGLSPDGGWLRVLAATGPAWVSRELVQSAGDLATLPALTSEKRSPMQAFYFTTGFGQPACNEAPPSTLVIQGPNNVKVDITANGADIRLGSTIGLRVLEGNIMQLFVLDGGADAGGVKVPTGYTMFVQLSEDGKSIVGLWSNLRPMTAEELAQFNALENFPETLLHYGLTLPTIQQIQRFQQALQQTQNQTNTGETGGTTTVGSCNTLRPTSPTVRLPYEVVSFYWDAEPGATSYRLKIYDAATGNAVFIGETSGTSLPVDAGTLGGGPDFTWEVEALVNGVVDCISGQARARRDERPASSVPSESNFSASWSCGDSYEVVIQWQNAGPGGVTVSFYDSFYGSVSSNDGRDSGSLTFTGYPLPGAGTVTSVYFGKSYGLPGYLVC